MKKTKTTKWDAAEFLTSDRHIAAYLAEAFEDGDPAGIVLALADVARAKGITEIAERAGVSRTSLYKALSEDARPEFSTVMKVITALGVHLQPTPIKPAPKRRPRNASRGGPITGKAA